MNKNKPVRPKKGDILGLNRSQGIAEYEHYGIYTGDGTVVNYTTLESGFTLDLEIMETTFEKFLKTEKGFFILNFDHLKNPNKSGPIPVYQLNSTFSDIMETLLEIREWLEKSQMKLYSPDETVSRARSRLGEKKYDLLLNNCEHFAIWCKTGLSKSYQIEKLLKVLHPDKGIFTNLDP